MSTEPRPPRQDQFIVRFPDGMRDEIAAAAKANGRSMNSEMIARLARPVDPSDIAAGATEVARANAYALLASNLATRALVMAVSGLLAELTPAQRETALAQITRRLVDDAAEWVASIDGESPDQHIARMLERMERSTAALEAAAPEIGRKKRR